jgi:hypothetical protein
VPLIGLIGSDHPKIDRQYSSGISVLERNTIASPVAMATPSRPSHNPASAMITHSTTVIVCHRDSMASTGPKKNPVPMYHDEPARSQRSTKRSHRGIDSGTSLGIGTLLVAHTSHVAADP